MKILYEDSELIQLELKRAGFDPSIHRVETEHEMLSALKKKKWDLITSDYQMPHFSAREAIKIWIEMRTGNTLLRNIRGDQ